MGSNGLSPFHRVAYDHDEVLALTATVNHPAYDYIRSFLVGERRPDWMQDEEQE